MRLWWDNFGHDDRELYIVGGYDGDRLVGIAPLYIENSRRRGLSFRTIQIIGGSHCPGPKGGVLSEYLDVLAIPAYSELFRRQILQHVSEIKGVNEFSVGLTQQSAAWKAAMAERDGIGSYYLRPSERVTSYQADLSGGIQAYLHSLSESARRGLWNKRRLLEHHGQVELEAVNPESINQAFDELNALHRIRWGAPAFEGPSLRFHQQLAVVLASRGELQLTKLKLDNRVVSVLYDIAIDDRQYNIQMGFDEAFDRRLALGLLHLGYSIERAASRGIRVYDFLAGTGRTSHYKSRIAQTCKELQNVQILRGLKMSMLFRCYDTAVKAFRNSSPVMLVAFGATALVCKHGRLLKLNEMSAIFVDMVSYCA